MKKLKLGYAPPRHLTFSAKDAFKYKIAIHL